VISGDETMFNVFLLPTNIRSLDVVICIFKQWSCTAAKT